MMIFTRWCAQEKEEEERKKERKKRQNEKGQSESFLY